MKKTALLAAALALSATGLFAAEKTVAVVDGSKITNDELTKKLWWQYGAQGLAELIDEKLLLAGYINKAEFEKNLKSVGWTSADLKTLLGRQILVRTAVMALGRITVSDEDAKAFFDKNKEKLAAQESIKLSQIFVNTKAEADEAYQLLTSVGADFAKLSVLKSADANLRKNNGSLGFVSRGMLLPEVEKEIFSLKPGQYSKVLATGNGFSIFMAEERKAAQEASFDKVKEELKAAILNQAITQSLPEITGQLRQRAKIEIIK